MKTKYIIDDPTVQILKIGDNTISDTIPPKIYSVKFEPTRGFYLETSSQVLSLPTTIYGGTFRRTEKCLATYNDRQCSTGILLTGDKGTGKSLQMAHIANTFLKQNKKPVIMIKQAYGGTAFTNFIEDIGECCLIFDEFAKMYPERQKEDGFTQHALLGLMDGVNKTKRLVILTENDKWDISEFMLNRPSRIYYHYKYKKLEESAITDFCDNKKIPSKITNEIIELSRKSTIFSFDILQTIVEEWLRYKEPLQDALDSLNVELKENTPRLSKVIKVVKNETGEELRLTEKSKIVNTEYEFRVDYHKNKNETEETEDGPETNQLPTPRNAVVVGAKSPKRVNNLRSLYLDADDLVYQQNNMYIYEDDGITVITELLPEQNQPGYSNFL